MTAPVFWSWIAYPASPAFLAASAGRRSSWASCSMYARSNA
nr:MAG TPA: hypothetical protein [Caudoviricetes sp.]